ncbi:MAG: hypothetical protein NZ602_00295 [Thermoguttaceae bacterium]|nr:hypothetical protein [Thermoguttaceae bacterium]MDW8038620.1 hypothetical protein [Thermoguttaceae bacterium]
MAYGEHMALEKPPAKTRWIAGVLLLAAGGYVVWRAAALGCGTVYVVAADEELTVASPWEAMAGIAQPSLGRTIGVWVAALLTLAIFSFLYKDNPLYKLAEALFVGVSAAYWMVVAFWTTLVPNLFGKLFPAWISATLMPGLSPEREAGWYWYFVPLVLGLMLLWRLAPRGAWIAAWPLAFIMGATAGIRLVGFLQADFLNQIGATIRPAVVVVSSAHGQAVDWTASVGATVQALLLLAGVLCCLTYFFFSVEHRGLVGQAARIGIWVLMITFGAAFGYTVMARIALLAGRLEFLLNDWLWLIDPAGTRPPDWTSWW